jgi:hypothetical protein
VASKINRSPQLFYNYQRGLSKPGTDMYIDLLNTFPDFDANYVLVGKMSRCDDDFEKIRKERDTDERC